jgi:hypothetical protein
VSKKKTDLMHCMMKRITTHQLPFEKYCRAVGLIYQPTTVLQGLALKLRRSNNNVDKCLECVIVNNLYCVLVVCDFFPFLASCP